MIYSIGYEGLSLERLQRILKHFDAKLVDVRGMPRSRKAGFSQNQLGKLLGERYAWMGKFLGNKGENHVTDAGLRWVADHDGPQPNIMLMCMERAPAECHRHHLIARPLSTLGHPHRPVDVVHIFDNELVLARDLQASLDDPDPEASYDCETFDV